METMLAGISVESQKLLFKKKSIALLIISVAITVLGGILALFFQNSFGIIPVKSANFPVWILGYFTSFFIPLFVFMTAGDLFAGELSDRTLKLVLLKPISRMKAFASKIIALGIYIVLHLGVIYLTSTLISLFLNGKEGLFNGLFKNFLVYGVALMPMLLLGIFAVFISQFFKSSSGVLAISILAFMAFKIISILFPGIENMLLTSYTDWHLLFAGTILSIGKILNIFMFMLSYSIIFLASGYVLFERREF